MSEFNALDQGDGGKAPQDEMGFELDPVTDPASDKDGHSAPAAPAPAAAPAKEPAPAPAPAPKSGTAPTTTNAEAKDNRIAQKKEKISQEEWQATQETIATQSQQIAALTLENARSKFEAKNPIVTSEKYAAAWEELCKAKANPEHKYHRLDFADLKQLMITSEVTEENRQAEEEITQRPPVTPPTFGSSPKPKMPGGVDPESYAILKAQGFTDAQIADSDRVTLA